MDDAVQLTERPGNAKGEEKKDVVFDVVDDDVIVVFEEVSVVFDSVTRTGLLTEPVSAKCEHLEEGEVDDSDEEEPIYIGTSRSEKAARVAWGKQDQMEKDEMLAKAAARRGAPKPETDALPSLDDRRSRSRSPHRDLASYSNQNHDGRTRSSPSRGRRDHPMSSAQSMVPDCPSYDHSRPQLAIGRGTVAHSVVGCDHRSTHRSPSRRRSPMRGNEGAASVIAGTVVAREIQVVRIKEDGHAHQETGMPIKREKKEESEEDGIWRRPRRAFSRDGGGAHRRSSPRPHSRSPRRHMSHSSRRSSHSPLRRPPSPIGGDVDVVRESRRSISRSSDFGDNSQFDDIVVHVKKRPGNGDDPVGFDRFNPEVCYENESVTIVVHSDEEKKKFRVVMLDPTYGSYHMEAKRVVRGEFHSPCHSMTTYEYAFTPTMYGPHAVILTQDDFFLVHSISVRGTGPSPQRGNDQNRPRLPRLDVNGVPHEMRELFHAPRPRRADEKFVDPRQVLERLLG